MSCPLRKNWDKIWGGNITLSICIILITKSTLIEVFTARKNLLTIFINTNMFLFSHFNFSFSVPQEFSWQLNHNCFWFMVKSSFIFFLKNHEEKKLFSRDSLWYLNAKITSSYPGAFIIEVTNFNVLTSQHDLPFT